MPRNVDGIIDEIDRLVDESLSKPIVDDYNVNRFPRCWHCGRNFHGMPLTQRIADMYQHGVFDESYRVDEDDSEILCPGSDFIGPVIGRGSVTRSVSPNRRVSYQVRDFSPFYANSEQTAHAGYTLEDLQTLRDAGWVDLGRIPDGGIIE